MKTITRFAGFVVLLASLSLGAISAQARDARHFLPIRDAIKMGRADGKLGSDVRLYFGRQTHPPVNAMLAKGVVTNKKTNRLNKSDRESCNWVMLSALIQLQERARDEGGNAVINIRSYFKKRTFSSESQYECRSGAVVSGVALKGDVVRLRH